MSTRPSMFQVKPLLRVLVGCLLLGAGGGVGQIQAQPPEGGRYGDARAESDAERRQAGGPLGRRDMTRQRGPELFRASPLFAALDENLDGELSAKEIASASEALKKLDTNLDGKLDRRELQPRFPAMAEQGENARRAAPTNEGMAAQFKRLDRDGNGGLSEEETPERLRRGFSRIDTNQDGLLSPAELHSAAERRQAQFRRSPRDRQGASDDQPTPGGEQPKRP